MTSYFSNSYDQYYADGYNYTLHQGRNDASIATDQWMKGFSLNNLSFPSGMDRTEDLLAFAGKDGSISTYKRLKLHPLNVEDILSVGWVPLAPQIVGPKRTGFGWRVKINSSFNSSGGRIPTSNNILLAVSDIGWSQDRGRILVYVMNTGNVSGPGTTKVTWKLIKEFYGTAVNGNLGFDLDFRDNILSYSLPGGNLGNGTLQPGYVVSLKVNPVTLKWSPIETITSPTADRTFTFGQSIALSNDRLVVSGSSFKKGTDQTKPHTVHTFIYKLTKDRFNQDKWQLEKEFKNSTPGTQTFVGNVALVKNVSGWSTVPVFENRSYTDSWGFEPTLKDNYFLAAQLTDRIIIYRNKGTSWEVSGTLKAPASDKNWFGNVIKFTDLGDLYVSSGSTFFTFDQNKPMGQILSWKFNPKTLMWSSMQNMSDLNDITPKKYLRDTGVTHTDSQKRSYGYIYNFLPSSIGYTMLVNIDRSPAAPPLEGTPPLMQSSIVEYSYLRRKLKNEVIHEGNGVYTIGDQNLQLGEIFSLTRQGGEKPRTYGRSMDVAFDTMEDTICIAGYHGGENEGIQVDTIYNGWGYNRNDNVPTFLNLKYFEHVGAINPDDRSSRKSFVISRASTRQWHTYFHGGRPLRILVGSQGFRSGKISAKDIKTVLYEIPAEYPHSGREWTKIWTSPSNYESVGDGLAISSSGLVFATSNRQRKEVLVMRDVSVPEYTSKGFKAQATPVIKDYSRDSTGFGDCISLNADGTRIAVTSPFFTSGQWKNRGKIDIYETRDGWKSWTLIQTIITPSTTDKNINNNKSGEGMRCQLNAAGNVLAVMYPSHNRVYIWTEGVDSNWVLSPAINNSFDCPLTEGINVLCPVKDNKIEPYGYGANSDYLEFVDSKNSQPGIYDFYLSPLGTNLIISSYNWKLSNKVDPSTGFPNQVNVRGNMIHNYEFDGYSWHQKIQPTLIDFVRNTAGVDGACRVGLAYSPEGKASEAYPRYIVGTPIQNNQRGLIRVFSNMAHGGYNRTNLSNAFIKNVTNSIKDISENLPPRSPFVNVVASEQLNIAEGDTVVITMLGYGLRSGTRIYYNITGVDPNDIIITPLTSGQHLQSSDKLSGSLPGYYLAGIADTPQLLTTTAIAFKIKFLENFTPDSTKLVRVRGSDEPTLFSAWSERLRVFDRTAPIYLYKNVNFASQTPAITL